ncbi:MAG: HEAT repeat domain-containing protein [bacterium]|nr:HEAT repeat domain-containing protein [bacterium]
MPHTPMRLRIPIAITVLLAPLIAWSIISSPSGTFGMSSEEQAIDEDQINGNIDGLAEKARTYKPELAKKAVRAMGHGGKKSIPALKTILQDNKRPELRQQAAMAMAKAVMVAAEEDKPLDSQMTAPLVIALMNDKTPEVRASAADALGQVYDYSNMSSLLKAMDDEDLTVRRKAYNAVSRIFGREYIFDPNSPSPKRKIIIKAIATDWKVYEKHIGKYHDHHHKIQKPRR